MEMVDIYLVPPLQGGKTRAGFHKPRVRTLGWFVKALQAYIDTVRAVREPPLPTTLHSFTFDNNRNKLSYENKRNRSPSEPGL
ncbi:hypothetical protein CE91St1_10820 [Parabacteroides goldsteinii]|nr:hypothetical protein CE91St1_10820 [Parabacteroides goldsteinii]GKG77874.1 hypothetical protein CE91St2_10660 [Parabacteroides goldsteinii]